MRFSIFFLLLIFFLPDATGADNANADTVPCLNIPHSVEVIACMMDLAETKKKEYIKEYNSYLKSISLPQERYYNKKIITRLTKKARKNWDIYSENECMAEASVYEKDSYGYNDTYNACLIKHYDERIKYYRNKK